MDIKFNKERIKKLMHDFYYCVHIPITIFDSDFNCIYGYGGSNEYCDRIRRMTGGVDACNRSDQEHFRIVNQTKDSLVYSCHAGICESITPILYENVVIAYLMLGKFRDENKEYSSVKHIRETAEKYGLDKEEMLRAYKKVPVWTERELHAAIDVLNICIQYIWNENLIYPNKNMLPAQIESYIEANLTADLSIDDLCREFFISKQMLYSVFRENFNDTVKNFILKKRMQEARRLLKETDLPISDISRKCGFTDYNYFIRLFRNKNGITPLRYRKEYR